MQRTIKKIIGFLVSSTLAFAMFVVPARADSVTANFENPPFVIGNINGQDSWLKTGSFDVEVVTNTFSIPSFGLQSLRISDAVTSGSFGDQTFAKPLVDAVGEVDSTDGTFSRGTLKSHFEVQFDFASTMLTEQVGMHASFSPDRGDGSRMSYLRFDDKPAGVELYFDDVTNPGPLGTGSSFNEVLLGTLSRSTPHTVKLTMDMLDGPANDIVKVYLDGSLVHTGTSWEDYYRFDPESIAEQSPRIIKTVLFRESGSSNPGNSGKGFLFDNLSITSGPVAPVLVAPPTSKKQCKNDGWMTFNNPPFTSKKDCENYVKEHKKDGKAQGELKLAGPSQKIKFEVKEMMEDHDDHDDHDEDEVDDDHKKGLGKVEYWNYDYPGGLHYKAQAMCVSVDKSENSARFMFQIPSGHTGLSGIYVVSYVKDVDGKGVPDLYGHAATADLATAQSWCESGVGFTPSMYSVTKGKVSVK